MDRCLPWCVVMYMLARNTQFAESCPCINLNGRIPCNQNNHTFRQEQKTAGEEQVVEQEGKPEEEQVKNSFVELDIASSAKHVFVEHPTIARS